MFIGESGGADDYFQVQQSPINPAFLEVFVDGAREYTGLVATVDKIIFNPGGGINTFDIGPLTGISSLTINGTNDIDIYNLAGLGAGTPLTMVLGGGNDVVSLAPNDPFSISKIEAPVTILGGTGFDTLNVGSGGLHAVSGLVTFDAGGGKIKLDDSGNPLFVDYSISDTAITRDTPFFFGGVNYSGVSSIELDASQGPNTVNIDSTTINTAIVNGNGGDDNFIIGNGNNLSGGIGLFTGNGGDGVDTLTLNDSFSTHNLPWAVLGNGTFDPQTIYLGLQAYDLEGYESATILGGNGNNSFQLSGTMAQNITLDAGGGNDTVSLTGVSNYQDFTGQSGPVEFHYTMNIDGGSGSNSLSVDDTMVTDRSYAIWPERILIDEGAPLGLDFDYDSFQSVTIQSPTNPVQFTPQFHVFGTSADIPSSNQMTIFGSTVADQFVLHPRDSAGNLTVNGNLGISGGNGFDTLLVDNTGSVLPINYRFFNQFGPGTTNIGGLGAANFGAGSNVESISVSAGGGSDTFNITTFQSGSGLAINGGEGDDIVNFGTTKITDITNMASFLFNGQGGHDTLYVQNTAATAGWTYHRNQGNLAATSTTGASYLLSDSNVELTQINSGDQVDIFNVNAVPSGTQLVLNAGGGLDGLDLGPVANNLGIDSRPRRFQWPG